MKVFLTKCFVFQVLVTFCHLVWLEVNYAATSGSASYLLQQRVQACLLVRGSNGLFAGVVFFLSSGFVSE